MPHVTVIFNPTEVKQPTVDELKRLLPQIVSRALSDTELMHQPNSFAAIKVAPEEILVCQQATHPTDVNVSPIEILIEAGEPKDRSQERVARSIVMQIREAECLPPDLIKAGTSCIWIKFNPINAFAFINDHFD